MIGSTVSSYRIEREIGEGGMSHVFVGKTIKQTEFLPDAFSVVDGSHRITE